MRDNKICKACKDNNLVVKPKKIWIKNNLDPNNSRKELNKRNLKMYSIKLTNKTRTQQKIRKAKIKDLEIKISIYRKKGRKEVSKMLRIILKKAIKISKIKEIKMGNSKKEDEPYYLYFCICNVRIIFLL